MFGEGAGIFLIGLAKKVLLANNIGMLWDTVKAAPPGELSVLSAWLGITAFAFQIYFDFSGYSDMAVGLGKMFGFNLPINFNYPYISRSATEFWRRWHISLGSWFREYVYIPLGGNRKGMLKQYRNILIVWFLTGLWHGASWNFVLWGLYYGAFLAVEKTRDYEKYVADQFPLRDVWIGVKTDLERMAGKRDSNGVYLGKDGYLLQGFKAPQPEILQKRVAALNSFAASLPEVSFYFMLVPNSVEILKEKLPPCAPTDGQLGCLQQVRDSLDRRIGYVDVYGTLYSHRNEEIYYKTDHHWTTKGAYYAYRKLGEVMGFTPYDRSRFRVEKVTGSFYGSLSSKSGFRHLRPDGIELYLPRVPERYRVHYCDGDLVAATLYFRENLGKKDKYAVFLNGNHPLIKITTAAENDKRLLLVKDSYANCLIPFLTGHFREIYVVDLRYYDEDLRTLIRSGGIQDVLFLYNVQTFCEEPSPLDALP